MEYFHILLRVCPNKLTKLYPIIPEQVGGIIVVFSFLDMCFWIAPLFSSFSSIVCIWSGTYFFNSFSKVFKFLQEVESKVENISST